MALTNGQQTGIIIAICLFVLPMIFLCTIIYVNHRRNLASVKHTHDAEAHHQHHVGQDPRWEQFPGALLQQHDDDGGADGGENRKTRPQTFYDWVRSRGTTSPNREPSKTSTTAPATATATTEQRQPQEQQRHDRFPSLENGPGPIIHSRPTKVTQRSTTTASTTLKVERPGTGDSVKASSLRQAVLDVGGLQGKEEEGKKEDGNKEEKKEGKNLEIEAPVRARGYSGAWP